jgi:hypothetical protein
MAYMLFRRLSTMLVTSWVMTTLAACSIDKATSASHTTDSSAGEDASTAASTSSGTWPPVQCGDQVCAEGQVCVEDQAWFCCSFYAATSTTGDDSTGAGTTVGSTTGDPWTTSGSTTGCQEYLSSSYTCKGIPSQCPGNYGTLESCLLSLYCPTHLWPESFHDGIVDCGAPNHGCY